MKILSHYVTGAHLKVSFYLFWIINFCLVGIINSNYKILLLLPTNVLVKRCEENKVKQKKKNNNEVQPLFQLWQCITDDAAGP